MAKKELIYQISGKIYIDVYIISGNRIIDRIIEEDKGQRWLFSKKMDKAFLVPDRSEGLIYGQKTIFFYSAETSTPLTIEEIEEIEMQDTDYIYGIDDNNRFIRFKNRIFKSPDNLIKVTPTTKKMKASKIVSTTIEPQVLKSIINTKIITELLKSPENVWETLKTPIIVGIIAITAIVIYYTM